MVLVTTDETCTWAVYPFSLLCRLVWGLVTLMANWAALSVTAFQFFRGTLWAVAVQWELLHISSSRASWCCGSGTSGSYWQHVLCFLVVAITSVRCHHLPLESFLYPIVNASGFCHWHLMLTSQSYWCWMNFLVHCGQSWTSGGFWGQLWCQIGGGCHFCRPCPGRGRERWYFCVCVFK